MAISTLPKVKDWDKLDDNEKKQIRDQGLGQLKKLLNGVGIKGWGDNVLEVFVADGINTVTSAS